MNRFAIGDAMPDLTILFRIDPVEGLKRIAANKDREQNRLDLEKIDFHQKVFDVYEQLIDRFPNRIQPIDASQPVEAVQNECLNLIKNQLNIH